jgi:transcriptional regulator with XRE-family HTH domain
MPTGLQEHRTTRELPQQKFQRQLRGFDVTQTRLASRISISQAYLSSIEHGKFEVGAEILLRIAREFGKSIEWLLTGEDRP